MGTAENKDLVRRFILEIVNTGEVDRIGAFVSPHSVEMDGTQRVLSAVEGMASHVRGVRATYSDLRLTIERQIAEGLRSLSPVLGAQESEDHSEGNGLCRH